MSQPYPGLHTLNARWSWMPLLCFSRLSNLRMVYVVSEVTSSRCGAVAPDQSRLIVYATSPWLLIHGRLLGKPSNTSCTLAQTTKAGLPTAYMCGCQHIDRVSIRDGTMLMSSQNENSSAQMTICSNSQNIKHDLRIIESFKSKPKHESFLK